MSTADRASLCPFSCCSRDLVSIQRMRKALAAGNTSRVTVLAILNHDRQTTARSASFPATTPSQSVFRAPAMATTVIMDNAVASTIMLNDRLDETYAADA